MDIRKAIVLGAGLAALGGMASAQEATTAAAPAARSSDPREARIQELEARLAEIETQIQDLREGTAADVADVRRIQSDAVQVTVANGRPQFATPDGQFKVAVRGLFQFDAANINQEDPTAAQVAAGFNDLGSGANFRRARIGIEGTAFRDWNYALTYEMGGSGVESPALQQAWLEYAGWKPWGLTAPVRIRAGAFAVENTLEGATSNTDALFLERASIAEIVRGTFGGDGRTGLGIYANGDRLNVSAILTGGLIGNTDISSTTSQYDEQTGFVTRVGALLLRGENSGLHLGANYSTIFQLPDGSGTGANTLRLRDRPELRVDNSTTANGGTARLLDTGTFSAENAQAYGVELGGQWRNLYGSAEYLVIEAERPGTLPNPEFNGWYVQGAWTITGEQHKWNAANGGFSGIRPANAFNPADGHWGAWELAARYSTVDLNFREGVVGGALPAGGVRGGEQTITSFGLNWYPNNVVRFMLDLQDVDVEHINGPTSAPANSDVSVDYQAIALRTQVSF